jgi:DNA-binding CsgD family transcriptional regulator/tetratricopeptide (TPR) repeat protein
MVAGRASVAGNGTASRRPFISAPAFTGREPEVAAISQALAGPPAVVLVEGEAGIGKTRLVREVLAGPGGQPGPSLVAACLPLRQPSTLSPLVDALRQATPDPGQLGLSDLAGALRPLFPEWAASLPAAPEPVDDPTAARYRLFRALAEVLQRLQVAVLVVEDVHWADDATMEFLLFLSSQQGSRPGMIVTYRPEDVPAGSLLLRLSSRLPGGAAGIRLSLDPLNTAETTRLVSSMLGGKPLSPEFAAFLHRRTDGVPLAAEELVRLMHDRADLARRGDEWVRRSLSEIIVPATIRDGVLERTGRLSEDAQAILAAAAVVAYPADERTLRSLAGLSAARGGAALTELVASGLLDEDRAGAVSFRHVLAERAVYEALAAPQRRKLHRRAGRLLERQSPPPIAQLTRHYREAAEPEQWCAYAEQAADLALAAGDDATAASLVHELLTGADLPAQAAVRLIRKVSLVVFTPAMAEGLVRALRATLAASGLDEATSADVRLLLGRILLVLQQRDAGRAELEQAIPGLGHDPVEAVRAMLLLGWPSATTWPATRHRQWLHRAAEITVSLPRADRINFTVERASALLMLGDEAGWEAAAQVPEGEDLTPRELEYVMKAHLNFGHFAILWGRYPQARRHLAAGLELARTNNSRYYRDTILITQTRLDWVEGRWEGLAERAAAFTADADLTPFTRHEALLVHGLMQAAAGDLAEAGQLLAQALDASRQVGAVDAIMEPAAALGRLELASGRPDDALAITEQPVRVLAGKQIWAWAADLGPTRADALVSGGRVGEAAALEALFAAGLADAATPAAHAALTQVQAIVAEGRGEMTAAASLFGRAAARWRALPRPYAALLAADRQARCLLGAGEQAAAVQLLSEVLAGLSALGARGDAVRIADTLTGLGVVARRPWLGGRRGYGDQLSPRELDVVRLLIRGSTNRQIAEVLVLSPKTVANHIDSIMRKLGVSSRTALAAHAVEAGLVGGDQPELRAPKSFTHAEILRG